MADREISSNKRIANLWGDVNFCYPNCRSILFSMHIFEEPPAYDSYCYNHQEDQNGELGISPAPCLHIGISSNCSSALRVMQFPASWLWPGSLGVLLSGAHLSPLRKRWKCWELPPAELFWVYLLPGTPWWSSSCSKSCLWEPGLSMRVERNHQSWDDLVCLCPMGHLSAQKKVEPKFWPIPKDWHSACIEMWFIFSWVKDFGNFREKVKIPN